MLKTRKLDNHCKHYKFDIGNTGFQLDSTPSRLHTSLTRHRYAHSARDNVIVCALFNQTRLLVQSQTYLDLCSITKVSNLGYYYWSALISIKLNKLHSSNGRVVCICPENACETNFVIVALRIISSTPR